jgi:Fe2+ or Zn2+ uptake regulation protein
MEEAFRQAHISKTSVYRILKTLVHRGYVTPSCNYVQHHIVTRKTLGKDLG